MKVLIKQFNKIRITDIPEVGGKNASLGEMFNELSADGVKIPDGFATTATAFWNFLNENKIKETLKDLMKDLDRKKFSNLNEIGAAARDLILSGTFSDAFSKEIIEAYHDLGGEKIIEVAVRSSATAEDLPQASFAGQHDTFLNVSGDANLLEAVKLCYASLYTNRAIKYREDQGFEHDVVALSVGIQKMVRADKGCSGIGFTLDPESGFKDVVHITGVWGLGENIVQGAVNPDEFYVFKPTLKLEKNAIIQKTLGSKEQTLIYAESHGHSSTVNISTEYKKQNQFVLEEEEILRLAKWAVIIEEHYQKPMDIEWAKDGISNEIFITQARPETVHHKIQKIFNEYKLLERSEVLVRGSAIGARIISGTARILESPREAEKLKKGDILITDVTSPDWDPVLKNIGGLVTNRGGRTSHAAIVARELGVPAIVGTTIATLKIKDGDLITVSCAEGSTGIIYKGALKFEENEIDLKNIKLPRTEVKFIMSDPEKAFQLSFYPNNGVGLLRMEFMITHHIKIHPMALAQFEKVQDKDIRNVIEDVTQNYANPKEFFVEELSQGIGTIAAAFYPKEVILRMSDFKSNEYANLLGGIQFEPIEENPMLGFRGAARYYHDMYKPGFKLECETVKKLRDNMGLTNIKVMIPFCRSLEEAKNVVELMAENGLGQGENGLEIYMMVEIPSNVILLKEFAEIFDGFSIGSNDLTQLTLGIDRDSDVISSHFNENDPAPKKMIKMAIKKARKAGKPIGLCGQAPSDFPEFAAFLVNAGINSISFNPDALISGIKNINKAEAKKLKI